LSGIRDPNKKKNELKIGEMSLLNLDIHKRLYKGSAPYPILELTGKVLCFTHTLE